MLTRIIAALALVPLFIFILIGGVPLYIAEIAMLAIALNEFYKAFKVKDIHPIPIIGYIFIVYLGLKNIFNLGGEYTYIVIFGLFIYSITYILRCKNNIVDISITFFSLFYIAISIDFIVLTINRLDNGHLYVWSIFIVAFFTDTFAYFAGYLFGKHKLIPKVSPKKTIEGSIGGILGSTVGCMVFAYLFNLDMPVMIIIGSVGSVIAQFGDLFASSIKRYVGIKDYGTLIPGHGGVLDRFDSVILVAPFVYYSIMLFSK